MKVLIVEDDPQVGDTLSRLLRSWQMDSVLVGDAAAAMSALGGADVDLVLSDLCLPGPSGLDLAERIRADQDLEDLPFLMISGQAGRDDILKASDAGIDGFLAKPFKPDRLRQILLETHRRWRRERWAAAAARVWRHRLPDDPTRPPPGPVALFGEGVHTEADLAAPERRPVVAFLDLARHAVSHLNRADDDLRAGYLISASTNEAILSLRRPGLRDQIRVLLMSTRCQGNPTLMARLFAINRRAHAADFYLVYDEVDDISAVHRKGLKDLGVRALRRSRFDRERMRELLGRHLTPAPAEAAVDDEAEALPPQQIRSRIVEDIDTMAALPPIPRVYEKISALARDPGSDLHEWIGVIQADPTACATILRQANALSLAVKSDVTQIDRAVILLGKNAVVGLVASAAMGSALKRIREKGFQLEELWLHNLAVGYAAQLLSHPLDEEVEGLGDVASLGFRPEALHTLRAINLPRRLRLDYEQCNPQAAGSLHDIGKGVMVYAYPGLFPLLRAQLEERGWAVPMLEAELAVAGGLTHTVAGDILVRRWEMTDQVGDSVAAHHTPGEDDGLSQLVGLADVIGQVLYPFPRDAGYPLARALEEGDWDSARPFLPAGLLDGPLIGRDELVEIVGGVGPRVRHFTEEMRRSLD